MSASTSITIGDLVRPDWYDAAYRCTGSRTTADPEATMVAVWADMSNNVYVGNVCIDECALIIASVITDGVRTSKCFFIVSEAGLVGWVHADEVRRL